MRSPRLVLISVLLGATALAGCGSSGSTAASATTGAPTSTVLVRSDVLVDLVDPPGADGRTLSLVRYTIAPGAKLVPHVHPGVQMARIESGALTYTIVSGTALVRRAGTVTNVPVTGPTTITLRPGDSVVETDGMVHFGENHTSKVLVIIATLLTKDGHKLAEPVTTTTSTPG